MVLLIASSCNTVDETYKAIRIKDQEWMIGNLGVDKFRNGDIIPEAKTYKEWEEASDNLSPAWCYLNNDSTNGIKYGKLYNWYAVIDPRGLAPKGWHIPNDQEWQVMIDHLGGSKNAAYSLKSKVGWEILSDSNFVTRVIGNGSGNNLSGFNAMPSGIRDSDSFIPGWCVFWSYKEGSVREPLTFSIVPQSSRVDRSRQYKGVGASLRCIKD